MISMVLEAGRQVAKDLPDLQGFEIMDMDITKAMVVPDTAHGLETALNMKLDADGGAAPRVDNCRRCV